MEESTQPVIGGSTLERRSEPRTPACERVTVLVEQTDGHVEFPAFLVDRSQRGLCIRHQCKQLPPGRRLRVSLAGDDLHTEVVWNWSVGELVMSGLRLL